MQSAEMPPEQSVLALPRRRFRLLPLLVLLAAAGAILWARGNRAANTAQTAALLLSRTPPGMALVPGGDFLIGSPDADADEDTGPLRRDTIPSFYIDLHEVTNREFHKFSPGRSFPAGEEELPAGSITFAEAAAYARWVGKRLPTELEWEKAARGTDGRRYPWGNTWEPGRVAARRKRKGDGPEPQRPVIGKTCVIGPSRLQPVGHRAAGASPYGCEDMAGNAWEWVQGFYNGNPRQRILRGGAVGYGERACRTYVRSVEGEADT